MNNYVNYEQNYDLFNIFQRFYNVKVDEKKEIN